MYSTVQRNIFKFPDSDRLGDPLSLRRKLIIASENHISTWIEDFNENPDELAKAVAEENLVLAARKAFELPAITAPHGVSDEAVLATLASFLEFLLNGSDPTINSPPTSRPCTGCP
jgi:hypothetical protein